MSEQNVQVTQADREVAAGVYYEANKGGLNWMHAATGRDRIRVGDWDNHPTVQAFARHRTRAEPDLVEVLKDPNAVHVNMLRGSIARPSVRQIIHIYGEEALRAEMTSQQPDLVEVLRKCADKLEQERDELLHSVCVVRDGMPDRSTISAEDAEFVIPFDDLIAEAMTSSRFLLTLGFTVVAVFLVVNLVRGGHW